MFHSIRRAYLTMHLFPEDSSSSASGQGDSELKETSTTPYSYAAFDSSKVFQAFADSNNKNNNNIGPSDSANSSLREVSSSMPKPMRVVKVYDAPFFTAWILTICTILFYPIHQLTVRFCSCMGRKGPKSMSRAISDAVQGFRERGMTLCKFT
jgi:hypothetical protein